MLFRSVAEKVGGVVLPMLFMGPDRLFDDRGTVFYGMDINTCLLYTSPYTGG